MTERLHVFQAACIPAGNAGPCSAYIRWCRVQPGGHHFVTDDIHCSVAYAMWYILLACRGASLRRLQTTLQLYSLTLVIAAPTITAPFAMTGLVSWSKLLRYVAALPPLCRPACTCGVWVH